MDNLLEFFRAFNVQTIISTVIIFWYFTRDIKAEMKILEAKIDKQSDRTDRLYEMFVSLQKETKDICIELLKNKNDTNRT